LLRRGRTGIIIISPISETGILWHLRYTWRRRAAFRSPPHRLRPATGKSSPVRRSAARHVATTLLERLPLLLERHSLDRIRPRLRKESRISAALRNVSDAAVGKLQVAARRRDRHLPADESRFAHLIAREPRDITEPAAMEIVVPNPGYSVTEARIPVYVCDIYISNVNVSVESAAVIAAPPPRVEGLIRRERHPTDIAKAEPDTPAAEPKKRYQRG
jgi:hypothetical protein